VASEDPWTSLAVANGSSQLIRSEMPRTWLRWLRVLSRSGGDLRLWELQATDFTDLENWHVFQGEKQRGRDRKHI